MNISNSPRLRRICYNKQNIANSKSMDNAGFLFAIGAAISWGLVYAIDQKILYQTSVLTYLFISALLTVVLLLPFIIFDIHPIKNLISFGKANLILILVSLVLTIIADFFILSSVKILGASTASIFEIAYPFFVVLFSFLLFRSVPNIYFFIGALFIFIGSIIIIRLS